MTKHRINIPPPLLLDPTDEDKKLMSNLSCLRCGTPLKLRVLGEYAPYPIGYVAQCPECDWRDWGRVL